MYTTMMASRCEYQIRADWDFNEKCKLYQRKAGDKIWPGKNNEVSEDDWHFVERMRKRQKNKQVPRAGAARPACSAYR